MKRLMVTLATVALVYGCASSRPQYSSSQFTTENYQQNVTNAIEFADNFVDFDQESLPQASLDAQDFSILLKADIAFNQGSYAVAGNSYYFLASKYHDPRLIYKGVICFEHSSSAPEHYAKLNTLIQQLLITAPNSNIAKLFGIRVAIENNDLATAKKNLHSIIQADPTKTRAILIFLATIISNDVSAGAAASLDNFAHYVALKYQFYPEADLVALTSYSVTANSRGLLSTADEINHNFPNWQVPLYWSAGILAKNEQLELLRLMLQHEIQRSANPDPTLQNLYIAALIRSDQLSAAESYTQALLAQKPFEPNLMVDRAIIAYKQGNNQGAINWLLQARSKKYTLDGAMDLAIASLYDYDGRNESARGYYQAVLKQNSLLAPAANMGILRAILATKNYHQADDFINQLAVSAKLSAYATILLKISLYVGLGQTDLAYQVVQQKIGLYSFDKSIIYLYASLSGLTNHTEQSIKWYKKYIALYPNDAIGYNDLGFILADKTPHLLQAQALAQQAYALAPNDPAILDTLGWSYYKLGQYDKAEYYVGSAYQRTQDQDTAVHLKQIYVAQHKTALAATVIVLTPEIAQLQFEQNLLNQALLILMYYQYGLDLSR